MAGYNFYETRSRTKVFGVDNEHGCAFCIKMHVDALKYAGKLNNKHVKMHIHVYVMIFNMK